MKTNTIIQKYKKTGLIAGIAVLVATLCIWGFSRSDNGASLNDSLSEVSEKAPTLSDLRVAVVSMDKIQMDSAVLKDLHKQRESFEKKLKAKLEKEQKAIEKEKTDIEKSQDVLSQEALQRRVVEYQRRINNFQRDLAEKAQSVEASYQDALTTIQKKHLDPVIEGIIAKKKLSLVIDGRMARVGKDVEGLDITDEVIKSLNKKVSSVKMATPKGF